ncbi:16S rRNA (guanine(966)-N(2))-methyltransferase RsmD [Mycoplasmopsis phocirhinis]|uniref:16S rRNA (Guanine(966)-N(2))-methyltransferase RsmD n=1 Tax=Mycoplasmopsis phocirhinis TaxID=142650 RepID=A0A4P6ML95_9BACT|nr:16S rRNA (guanine(966)-N(2))-methyltransferase RsmD [Mycoplasmopsis phocirhinis]QBF34355.1 16S rRNA (guanine(966)-N(2))-methyltransferase RsmD [Mycoplasmopsis phocirhinis]
MLRIISGKYRRMQIKEPKTSFTRPTKDSVREAIFNSIRFDIENKNVLDLFAGSGAMGLEALSNNAQNVIFIDSNSTAIETIQSNLKSLKLNVQNVFKTDSLKFLQTTQAKFDFIFIDPPYANYEIINESLLIIYQRKLLNENGQIIIETDSTHNIQFLLYFAHFKTKKYGKSFVIFLQNKNKNE